MECRINQWDLFIPVRNKISANNILVQNKKHLPPSSSSKISPGSGSDTATNGAEGTERRGIGRVWEERRYVGDEQANI
jgi:hypothetical protein